jgi:hypothetical protein
VTAAVARDTDRNMRRFTSELAIVSSWGLVAVLLGAACSTGAGDGRVWGSVSLPDCVGDRPDFNLGVDFFAADYFDGALLIRLQNGGRSQAFSDGIVIRIEDVELFADAPGQSFAVIVEPSLETFVEQGPDAGVPTTAGGSPARATLYLNELCPDNSYAFADGQGEIVFDSIYVPDESKRIRGSFHLEFIDPRDWESPQDPGPRADLFGEFDFNYSRGSPAQAFPR